MQGLGMRVSSSCIVQSRVSILGIRNLGSFGKDAFSRGPPIPCDGRGSSGTQGAQKA